MHIYVRRGGPNYQTGLAKMRALGEELGVPLEVSDKTETFTSFYRIVDKLCILRFFAFVTGLQVYGPEATMTGICKQAIDCVMATA